MTRLAFGKTRAQKRLALVVLALANLAALGLMAWIFLPFAEPLAGFEVVAAVGAVTVWLSSFVLLCINVADFLMPEA